MFGVKKGGEEFGGEDGSRSLGVRRRPGVRQSGGAGGGISQGERRKKEGKEEETLEKNNERLRVRE